jgi:hypothetical protein
LLEIRWILTDTCEIELPPPARKTIDLEGRVVKDGVKKALRDRQDALSELVDAVRLLRKLADSKPLHGMKSVSPSRVNPDHIRSLKAISNAMRRPRLNR